MAIEKGTGGRMWPWSCHKEQVSREGVAMEWYGVVIIEEPVSVACGSGFQLVWETGEEMGYPPCLTGLNFSLQVFQ